MICYPIHVKGKIDKAGILLWQIIMLTENWVLNTKERTISTQTDIMMKPFLIWINRGSSLRKTRGIYRILGYPDTQV